MIHAHQTFFFFFEREKKKNKNIKRNEEGVLGLELVTASRNAEQALDETLDDVIIIHRSSTRDQQQCAYTRVVGKRNA